ncbi:hypothetical protein BHM03_00059754 [Ensete ventricosum]|nr:hypothetical protein BHM03_00059754 [Ensete ventricosum]
MHLRLDLLLEAFMSSSNEHSSATVFAVKLLYNPRRLLVIFLMFPSLSRFFSIEVCDDLLASVNSTRLQLNRRAGAAHLQQHFSRGEKVIKMTCEKTPVSRREHSSDRPPAGLP